MTHSTLAEWPALEAPWQWRPAGPQDDSFARALFFEARPQLRALPLPPELLQQTLDLQYRAHEQGMAQAYPGAATLIVHAWGHPDAQLAQAVLHRGSALRLVDLAVSTSARRQGVASAVMRACLSWAHSLGLSLELSVTADNAPARALYERHGLRVTGGDWLIVQMRREAFEDAQ